DWRAATRLIQKARRNDGRMGGEREEMGLVGVLTLRLLGEHFGPSFAATARAARERLDASPPHVCEDWSERGPAGYARTETSGTNG
ncbi:MAG: asparagine synthetase B, partial [Rhodospirillales bacterium]|nr:asparagine synthetase B [Rhodospirillales bacterium]